MESNSTSNFESDPNLNETPDATQNSVLGTFFFGIRDIVLDIWKYEFLVLGPTNIRDNVPNTNFFSGIYIQIGMDWNQYPAGKKRIDSD